MNSTFLETGIPIPLSEWKDPQGDVILKYSCKECIIYFGCWIASGIPADYICKLTFDNAWAVRGYRLEFIPYKIKENNYHSCILEIENSSWLKQVSEQRIKYYPNWQKWDKRNYRHFVIEGHDNYYDIIAVGYKEEIIPYSEAGELKRLIDEA